MIACPNCGAANALGKVFCVGCGQKLPASSLVREDVERLGQLAARRRLLFRVINIVLTTWLVLCILLAAWPHRLPYYEKQPEGEAALSVVRKMRALAQALQKDEIAEADVLTEEVNAYLKYYVMRDAVGRNGSVRIDSDGVRVRWLVRLFASAEKPGSGGPVVSWDLRLRPSRRTGRLRVVGVTFGHLPLRWPLSGPVRAVFQRMCRTRPEWPLATHLSVGKIEPGKITLMTSGGASRDDALETMQQALPADDGGTHPAADGSR